MAGNPYAVQTADLGGIMTGLGSVLEGTRKRKAQEKSQQDLMQAYRSRDPSQVATVMAKSPEAGAQLERMMGFRDKQTKEHFLVNTRKILADPANAEQYIQERIEYLDSAGADSASSQKALQMYQNDPGTAKDFTEMVYAQLASPQEWKAYQNQKGIGKDQFKQQEIDIKRETLDMRKLENESRKDEQLLSRETNNLKRDELKIKIDERRKNIEARTKKTETAKNVLGQKAVASMNATDDTILSIDEFMANSSYINSVSGYTGKLPTLTVAGTDAEASFDNIRNNLTLENLDKMSGVLSETDIKILSNAASRLVPGMSKSAMMKEFRRIKTVLSRRKKKFSADAKRAGIDLTQPQAPAKDINTQAMDWAKANPSDPRAAQIMQKLGAQ